MSNIQQENLSLVELTQKAIQSNNKNLLNEIYREQQIQRQNSMPVENAAFIQKLIELGLIED